MKPFLKKRRKAVVGFVFIALLGGGYFTMHHYRDRGTVVHPVRGEIVQTVYGVGTVVAPQRYELTIGHPARIAQVFVKEGVPIEKGDPVIQLYFLPPFLAPFSGIVSSVKVFPEEIAFPQKVLVVITGAERHFIQVSLEQEAALQVRPGQRALINFYGNDVRGVEGRVRSVYPQESQFLVRVDLENSLPKSVLPGMSGDVVIEVQRKDQALLVPTVAIRGHQVTVKRGLKKEQIKVETGLADETMTEVTSRNLGPSDRILMSAQ